MRARGGPDKTKDPFTITSSHDLSRTLLYDLTLVPTKDTEPQKDTPGSRSWQATAIQCSCPEATNEEKLKAFVVRIQGAVLGIVALFGSVLIMIFVQSPAVALAAVFASTAIVIVWSCGDARLVSQRRSWAVIC